MQKTKLGVSTNLVGAIIFMLAFLTTFAGSFADSRSFFDSLFLIPLVLLVAYVLVKEESTELKATAMSAVLLSVLYFVLVEVFEFVPEFLRFLNFFLQFAKITLTDGWGIVDFLLIFVDWAFKVVFIIFSLLALTGKNVKLKFVEKNIQ